MRVYISVDIEGIAGVTAWSQCFAGEADYASGKRLMRAEAEAAALGALEGGASEVVVRDAHGSALNLDAEGWPEGVRLLSGWADSTGYDMVEGLDASFGALAFVGYHAGAGGERAVRAHTMSSSTVAALRIDGRRADEAVVMALRAGAMGVPVVLCAGDAACAAEVSAWLPGVRTITTKQGFGYAAALHRRPEDVRAELRAAMAQALRAEHRPVPFALPWPVLLEMDLVSLRGAELAAMLPGSTRSGATVARTVASATELATTVEVWMRLAQTAPKR